MSASPTGVELLVKEIVKGVARELDGRFMARKRLLPMVAAADYLGMTPTEVRRMVAAGEFSPVRRGKGRRGELLSIRWDQVDLENKTIKLRGDQTKNRRPRVLPIYGEMAAWLEMQGATRDAKYPECQWVFHRYGHQMHSFRKAWDTACKLAGLPGLLFQDAVASVVARIKSATARRILSKKASLTALFPFALAPSASTDPASTSLACGRRPARPSRSRWRSAGTRPPYGAPRSPWPSCVGYRPAPCCAPPSGADRNIYPHGEHSDEAAQLFHAEIIRGRLGTENVGRWDDRRDLGHQFVADDGRPTSLNLAI
jgi:hypothetical protein